MCRSELNVSKYQNWFSFPFSHFRYENVTSAGSLLQTTLDKGEDAVSKVFIGYLATRLNRLNDSDSIWQQTPPSSSNATYVTENNNSTASYIIEKTESLRQQIIDERTNNAAYITERNDFNTSSVLVHWKLGAEAGRKLLAESRTQLLRILNGLPVRDEVCRQTVSSLNDIDMYN